MQDEQEGAADAGEERRNFLAELPAGLASEVLSLLHGRDKATLRLVDHAHSALVSAQIKSAHWMGAVRPSLPARLPCEVERVDLFSCGPVPRAWLLHALGHVTRLRNLHVAGEDAWEPAPLKEGKRPAKPEEMPGALAALPDLLALACCTPPSSQPVLEEAETVAAGPGSRQPSPLPMLAPARASSAGASPAPMDTLGGGARSPSLQQSDQQQQQRVGPPLAVSSHLTSLTLMSVGCSLRRMRDRDVRLMVGRFREQPPGAGHALQRLALPHGLNYYRSLLQGVSGQLLNLRSLYLECGRWHLCGHYATHELSRLQALTHLSFRHAEDMLVSHITPLYLIPSLRSLDLGQVLILHALDGPPDPLHMPPGPLRDPAADLLDPASLQVLTHMAEENGWPRSAPFVTPVQALLTQLGRCTSLTALNLRDVELPWDDAPEVHGQLTDMLRPLARTLRALDLSLYNNEALQTPDWLTAGLSCLTGLTRLELDQVDQDVSVHGAGLIAALKDTVLPGLRHVALSGLRLTDWETLVELKALTQVTFLDLGQPHTEELQWSSDLEEEGLDVPSVMAVRLHQLLDSVGAGLVHLGLHSWPLHPARLADACSNLRSLDLTYARITKVTGGQGQEVPEEERASYLSSDDVWGGLPHLERLTCWFTPFNDAALLSVLHQCRQLQVLELEGCNVTGLALRPFTNPMQQQQQHPPASPGAALVADPASSSGAYAWLPPHTRVDTLNLDSQRVPLTDQGVQQLCLELPGLVSTSLRDSQLGPGSWLALGTALPHLRHLQVSGCPVGDEQLRLLAQGSVPLSMLEAHPLLAQGLVPRLRQEGRVRPGERVALFPSLLDLEVTDDRLEEGHLTPLGVDALTQGMEAGACALRELRVYEPPQPGTPLAPHPPGHLQHGQHGDGNGSSSDGEGSSSSFETASEEGAAAAATEGGGSGSALGSDEEEDGSEWEEVVLGQDDEVDEVVGRQIEASRRPRILEQPRVAAWLRQGLMVRNTQNLTQEEERARSWLEVEDMLAKGTHPTWFC